MEVKTRLINYYRNNAFIQKYIVGMNPNTDEIVLSYNGLKKNISIDDLENIVREEQVLSFLNGNIPLKEDIVLEPRLNMVEPKVVSNELEKETLNDIKILTEIKSKIGLDNLVKDFAINELTGLIDINKAIDIVEENTINEVVKSIKGHYDFDLDLEHYDKTGKYIGNISTDERSTDEKIVSSFNNVRVYLEAANMYVDQVHFSEEDINNRLGEYIEKVKLILNPVKATPKPITPVKILEARDVYTNQSAGFADIFVLCLIVIVYAVIIVNLLLKLI